tara:strand:+ start:830 stop:1027 length:198 start_codon:yes stop_codon:yes gene_type:complete
MQKLNVHFVNRGYGTDEGEHTVELFGTGLCEYTSKPLAEIRSPFGLKDNRFTAQYEGNKWVCDLD